MRKIILLFMCIICTTVFGQDMVRELYPGTTVSPAHHMTFLGISMGKSPSAFGTSLKQKGLKNYLNDEYGCHFKGNLLGISNFSLSITTNENNQIDLIYSYKEFSNKKNSLNYFNQINQLISSRYTSEKSTRKIIASNTSKASIIYWDIFSEDKVYLIGAISLRHQEDSKYNTYNVELRIEDVSNNDIDFVQKRYDLSKYLTPAYSDAYLDVFPKYSNLTLRNTDNSFDVYNIFSPNDFIKFIESEKYNDIEKQFIFNEYAKEIKKMKIPKSSSFYDIETIYKLRLDYDRAKESYLASHPKNNNGIANFIFDSIVGQDLVNLYKQTGQYDYFINCLKQGSRNRSQGGSSTNWDNLNDAQKAAIHEHDNAR